MYIINYQCCEQEVEACYAERPGLPDNRNWCHPLHRYPSSLQDEMAECWCWCYGWIPPFSDFSLFHHCCKALQQLKNETKQKTLIRMKGRTSVHEAWYVSNLLFYALSTSTFISGWERSMDKDQRTYDVTLLNMLRGVSPDTNTK